MSGAKLDRLCRSQLSKILYCYFEGSWFGRKRCKRLSCVEICNLWQSCKQRKSWKGGGIRSMQEILYNLQFPRPMISVHKWNLSRARLKLWDIATLLLCSQIPERGFTSGNEPLKYTLTFGHCYMGTSFERPINTNKEIILNTTIQTKSKQCRYSVVLVEWNSWLLDVIIIAWAI